MKYFNHNILLFINAFHFFFWPKRKVFPLFVPLCFLYSPLPLLVAFGIHVADWQAIKRRVGSGETPLPLGLDDVVLQSDQLVVQEVFSVHGSWGLLLGLALLDTAALHDRWFHVLDRNEEMHGNIHFSKLSVKKPPIFSLMDNSFNTILRW